ncbi:MAG: class I SAM-dependent methyltransferase [bacterium]|nr:class I SAM-dependent methyltransferase [bacterium]
MVVSEQVTREKSFHDQRFLNDPRRVLTRFYAVHHRFHQSYDDYARKYFPNREVLEYGCGALSRALYFAHLTKHFTAIDISQVAIQLSIQKANELQIGHKTTFLEMNAEALNFADQSFDVVIGAGILHHLDLEKSISEIKRVLKPNGIGIFAEPLGHNPLINLFRKITPKLRSADEHPLLMKDLQFIQSHFPKMETTFYSIITPYLAFFPKRVQPTFLPWFERMDQKILQSLLFQRYAWFTLIKVEK